MIKNKLVNNLISLLLILAVLSGGLAKLTQICQLKQSVYTYSRFFDSNEDTDVFFMGSSRMINAVFPMQLWKDYGITSYNLGAHANLLPATYWELENALCAKTPKLVVVDTYGIENDFKYETPEYLHSWMDAFPLNATKIKAVMDLSDDPYKEQAIAAGNLEPSYAGMPIEFIWSFIKYHTRWDEINDEDFVTPTSSEKGAEARIRVESFDKIQRDKNAISDRTYVGEEYLKKIIESCQSKGIDVLLTYLPSESDENHYSQINKTAKIAADYGVDFVSLFDDELIDRQTDYYDSKHLNPLGARKTTDYLGEYISSNYNISDKRGDEAIANSWVADYQDYVYYRSELMARSDEAANVILQLAFEDFDSVIEVYNPYALKDDNVKNLLAKLSVDVNEAINKCETEGACVIVISEGGAGAAVCSMDEVPGEYMQKLDAITEDGNYVFEPYCNIRVSVINRLNGEVTVKEL